MSDVGGRDDLLKRILVNVKHTLSIKAKLSILEGAAGGGHLQLLKRCVGELPVFDDATSIDKTGVAVAAACSGNLDVFTLVFQVIYFHLHT